VVDGYYRSGTTAVQKALERAGNIVIHEPHTPDLINMLNRYSPHPVHGYDVAQGYASLEPEVRRKLLRAWYKHRTPLAWRWEQVKALLDPLHESKIPLIVKSTQLSLFLDEIRDEYGCYCVHLVRNVYDTVWAHAEIFPESFARVVFRVAEFDQMFYVDSVHRILVRHFGVREGRNVLEKLLRNIYFVRSHAGGHVVRYEDKVEVVSVLRNAGLHVDSQVLKPKVNVCPDWLKEKIDNWLRRRWFDEI